jgi:hypothetical protein
MRLSVAVGLAALALGCGACSHRRSKTPAQEFAFPEPVEEVLAEDGIDPDLIHCNRDRKWGGELRADAQAAVRDTMEVVGKGLSAEERAAMEKKIYQVFFWRMVRAVLVEENNNNLGVIAIAGRSWTDDAGNVHPLLVFRSGVTPSPEKDGSCVRSLMEAGHVRHMVNLFDGDVPVEDLVAAEGRVAKMYNATYHTATDAADGYGPWRDLLHSHYDDADARKQASLAVARLVKHEILEPEGAPPRGNIHMHCGGGMHRSGMVAGVIEKCVNHAPMAEVEAHYRYHVGWESQTNPGGAEENNLQFIRDFDCGLIDVVK